MHLRTARTSAAGSRSQLDPDLACPCLAANVGSYERLTQVVEADLGDGQQALRPEM